MSAQDLYLRFFVALAIGLVVGIERGWRQRDEPSGQREAGVRTFTILSMLGFAAGASINSLGPLFAAVLALGVVALVAIAYWTESLRQNGDRGLTTEVAALLTFALGGLAAAGALLAAGVTAVVLVALLDQKERLHTLIGRIEKLELSAAVKLLLVSVVLLPVLPDEGFGPGLILNPYELWLAVVVIGTLGLAGHAAIKVAGPHRGALMMGLFGGLVSSTGVTLSAAHASKNDATASKALASAVATAQAVMFARTALLASVLNPRLVPYIALPLILGAVTAIAGAFLIAPRAGSTAAGSSLHASSPDTLLAAMQFVAVVAVVLLMAHFAQLWGGDYGLILSSVLPGAVDVDAATVSASKLASRAATDASFQTAAASIAVALVMNSIVKCAIAYIAGSATLAKHAIMVLGASAIAVVVGVGVDLLLK